MSPSPRRESAADFVDALEAAGVEARLLDARPLTHEGVNAVIGDPEDTLVTPVLGPFLERCIQ